MFDQGVVVSAAIYSGAAYRRIRTCFPIAINYSLRSELSVSPNLLTCQRVNLQRILKAGRAGFKLHTPCGCRRQSYKFTHGREGGSE